MKKYTKKQLEELEDIRDVMKQIRDQRRELLKEYRGLKRQEYKIVDQAKNE